MIVIFDCCFTCSRNVSATHSKCQCNPFVKVPLLISCRIAAELLVLRCHGLSCTGDCLGSCAVFNWKKRVENLFFYFYFFINGSLSIIACKQRNWSQIWFCWGSSYHIQPITATYCNLPTKPTSHLTAMSPRCNPLPRINTDQKNQSANHKSATVYHLEPKRAQSVAFER